ncbi:superoxide dismutase [Spirosoma arcticum]
MRQLVAPFIPAPFELPPLPYALDALEPFISSDSVDLLYNGYHTAYVLGLNGALRNAMLPAECSLPELLIRSSSMGVGLQTYVAGHYNLSLFWKTMSPWAGDRPAGILAEAIQATFGGLEPLVNQVICLAHQITHNGWIWLVSRDGRLLLVTTIGHRNPLMDCEPADQRGLPILGLNIWKQAYHGTYENRVADYTAQWWPHINWREVENLYQHSL